MSSPPRKGSSSAEWLGDEGEGGGSVVVVGSGMEVCSVAGVGSGTEVGAPVLDTLVRTPAVVVVVASVKIGGGTGIEVGGI